MSVRLFTPQSFAGRFRRFLLPFVFTTAVLQASDPFWDAHVAPILQEHCHKCHGGNQTKSGLDLTTPEGALRGGDSGPSVLPGDPDRSPLIRLVTPGADPIMPPKGDPLRADQIELLQTWVRRLGTNSLATATAIPEPLPPRPPAWRPPDGMGITDAVDRFIERGWKERGVRAARPADDRTWARRVWLDLAGQIPSQAELEAFLDDRSPNRREHLVDRLLSSDAHVLHLREVWDTVLMGRAPTKKIEQRAKRGWHSYLEDVIRRDRPWDEVVRELIVARPSGEGDRGAAWFLYERDNNPQAMAEAVAPMVFGLQVQCAQCHDHMVAREIKQAHYWGMVAAFNRSKNVDTPAGFGLAESAIGGFVTFANLRKESQPARLTFFNGRSIDESWPEEGAKPPDDPALYLVPPPPEKQPAQAPAVPRFSRRSAFADAVTRDNPLLARATVNRAWALLFGRGLVHPVELMDSKHPPSHPDLLDWLAERFADDGHHLRPLIRALVLSRVYGLDSRPADQRKGVRVEPDAFASMLTRPLSAEQLHRSLTIATGPVQPSTNNPAQPVDDDLRRALVQQFPDLFPIEYNATLQQALFLSNSPLIDALLADRPDSLLQRLNVQTDPARRVRMAFLGILGREPDREERQAAEEYLRDRPATDGNRQLAWALLTGAEFQLIR